MISEFTLLTHLLNQLTQYASLNSDFIKHLKGYIGEKKLDYYLDFFPDIGIYVLHDLRLKGTHYFYQLDTFMLTPYFCLVIEIKNLGGNLFFDQHSKQCFQIINNFKKNIENPITQASRQTDQIQKKIHKLGIYRLPLEYVVLICSSSTKIETDRGNEELYDKVFHMEHIVEHFQTLSAKYKTKVISEKKLKNLAIHLASEHVPQKPDLIKKHQIDRDDHLKKGAQCQSCLCPMIWVKGQWYCVSCKTTSKNAHEVGILHNLLNLNPTITNKEWREFIESHSRKISYEMLNSVDFLERTSANKNRYTLTQDWQSKVDLETLILNSKF